MMLAACAQLKMQACVHLEAWAAWGIGEGLMCHARSVERTLRRTCEHISRPALLAVRGLIRHDAGYLPFADFEPAARLSPGLHDRLSEGKATR